VSFDDSIEAIAASYIEPPAGMASVRLFNLSPDTVEAGWTRDGQTMANGVKFLTGSNWVACNATPAPYELDDFDSSTGTGTVLLTGTWAPPSGASTIFVLGLQANSSYPPEFRNLTDAPESTQ
jgi:hypothetical protein